MTYDRYDFMNEGTGEDKLVNEPSSSGSTGNRLWLYLTYFVVYLSFVLSIVAVILASMALQQEKHIIQQVYKSGIISTTVNTPSPKPVTPPAKPVFTGNRTSRKEHGCPLITYHFPRNNQIIDYILYKRTVPRMTQATVCAWIDTNDYQSPFTSLFSYGAGSNYNAYLIGMKTTKSMQVYVRDQEYNINVTGSNIRTRFHFCQWFSTITRRFGLYINGQNVTNIRLRNNYIIKGGGQLYLGQEQDGPKSNPQFDSQQSLQGNVTNFLMWPRVLSAAEVQDVVNNCSCPGDYSIYLGLDRVELHGEASYSIPNVCPTLSNYDSSS